MHVFVWHVCGYVSGVYVCVYGLYKYVVCVVFVCGVSVWCLCVVPVCMHVYVLCM